ncbi:MAG: PepSY-associated TM helix domain-containing protein, partial [Parabacteroides sp.]|nr:PepSY-associated TM helix domain-containing protein [Parabacteroides sp.]
LPIDNLRRFFYSLHTGTWGGLTTRILYFLTALIGGILPLSGYYLWWKKRKRE